ncbi:maleylacetate reductase, partial [mine drainage metagenome]
MKAFAYDALPGRVVFEAGASRDRLAEELQSLGVKRVLLISTEQGQRLAKDLAAPLGELLAGHCTEVRPHVPIEIARRARQAASEVGADCLLSIGGGSTTGTAKAIALETGTPIVAVPTTYAGSEMTPVWGITQAQRKTTGRAPHVQPKVVIYDPELTFSLPPSISGPSAMNALAHCVEAFYATGGQPHHLT